MFRNRSQLRLPRHSLLEGYVDISWNPKSAGPRERPKPGSRVFRGLLVASLSLSSILQLYILSCCTAAASAVMSSRLWTATLSHGDTSCTKAKGQLWKGSRSSSPHCCSPVDPLPPTPTTHICSRSHPLLVLMFPLPTRDHCESSEGREAHIFLPWGLL